MDEWQVIAILDKSAGNDEVGEMWQVTAIFDQEATLFDVMKWAAKQKCYNQIESFQGRLTLTIAQNGVNG